MKPVDWTLRAVQIAVGGLSEREAMLLTYFRGSSLPAQEGVMDAARENYFDELPCQSPRLKGRLERTHRIRAALA